MGSFVNLTGRDVIFLGIQACHLVDLPDNRVDCPVNNTHECIKCPHLGRFATGERLDDYNSSGHLTCLILWIVILFIGTFGTIANILIILILRRQKSERGFDTFLMGLASFDILCSLASVISATGAAFYFENWSRNFATVCAFCGGILTAIWGRSGSSFMTVLITFERYLVIAFPVRFGNSFTVKRARLLVFGVLIWSLLMGLPRFTSSYIGRNVWRDIDSLKDTEYIIYSTPLEKFWFHDMYGFFDQIDFWAPLPLLLFFNGLIYYHVRKFQKRRKELNMKHLKDIRSAKMFLPVIIVLFLCNVEPIIHYYLVFNGNLYRELYSGMLTSFVVNSAANLPIYYLKGSSFRKETRALITSYFPRLTFENTQGESSVFSKGNHKTGATASSDSNDKHC